MEDKTEKRKYKKKQYLIESEITNKAENIIKILEKKYPEVGSDLAYSSVFELLVATILSAQCTDERVNSVTPKLFRTYTSISDFANANQDELEKIIFATGLHRNKAKSIIICSNIILKKFGGKVPETMSQLTELPGVGRKTANCILGAFFEPEGIVVDTHVIRLAGLIGFIDAETAKKKNPDKIEKILMATTPREYWYKFPNYLIQQGRKICIARRQKCSYCEIKEFCDYYINKVNKID
jgi:endonuclease-3